MPANPGLTETYICVDVETAGPIPPAYSLLAIGACTLDDPPATFYLELQPLGKNLSPEAAAVHHLSMSRLASEGVEPGQAMLRFEQWLQAHSDPGRSPVFVAFNAPFDWMFVHYYFITFLGHNPFGHAALDIKALYMGLAGVPWSQTSWRCIRPHDAAPKALSHHALQDALDQAGLFRTLLDQLHAAHPILGENPHDR